jgi:predicted transcriptional regulator
MKMTTNEFAKLVGLKQPQASGALMLLEKLGIVHRVGEVRKGKGKPAILFEIPEHFKVQLPSPDFEVFDIAA